MEIFVNVIGQKLKIPSNLKRVIAGSKKFIKLIFTLSSEWTYITPHVKFIQGNNVFDASLGDSHTCYLPSGIVPGEFTMMLYGIGADGDIIAVTDSIKLVADSSYFNPETDGENTEEDFDENYIATFEEILDYLETGGDSDQHDGINPNRIASIEEVMNYLNI